MRLRTALVLLLQSLFVVFQLWPAETLSNNCTTACGNIIVPYPFGLTNASYSFGVKASVSNCPEPRFLLRCNSTFNPPRLTLGLRSEVINISYAGQMTILSPVTFDCFNKQGERTDRNRIWMTHGALLTISDTENKFTTLGCDTISNLTGMGHRHIQSGCSMFCVNQSDVIDGSCTGIGCCQTSIPRGFGWFNISLRTFQNHIEVHDFNPCSYAFIAQSSWFNFSRSCLTKFTTPYPRKYYSYFSPENRRKNFYYVPVVWDWAVSSKNCSDAQKNMTTYACRGDKNKSKCVRSKNGVGYSCICSDGYQGNPYLDEGLGGCTDINECKGFNNCSESAICKNGIGSYSCRCPWGYKGNGWNKGTSMYGINIMQDGHPGCRDNVTRMIRAIGGTVAGFLGLSAFAWVLYWAIQRKRRQREKFFNQNGGLLLQQQIASKKGGKDIAKIFSIEALKKATNNFHESQIIGEGGFGRVYKGTLSSGKVAAIKKSKIVDKGQIIQFINEVDILSQIKHRHVVKLLGCCLEIEVPLLVYEFISNGTLSEHIQRKNQTPSLSWGNRLRIAAETADALAYLHSSHEVPIFHRDVKSSNILLDDKYRAKVSDFGASRLVPLDETQKMTQIQGTHGYLDPECVPTGQLTDKSDVYSFGVVLLELLTGKKPLLFEKSGECTTLVSYFLSSMKDGNLFNIIDDIILIDGKREQLLAVAELARDCLKDKREDRPTMKEVAKELDSLKMFYEQSSTQLNQETEPFLGEPSTNSTDATFEMEMSYCVTDDDLSLVAR